MKLMLSLSLISLITFNFAFAQDATKERAKEIRQRVQNMKDYCLPAVKSASCKFVSPDDTWWDYRRSMLDKILAEAVTSLARTVREEVKNNAESKNNTIAWVKGTEPPPNATSNLETLGTELRTYATQNKFTDCQKACLAKCASASLIDYDYEHSFNIHTRYARAQDIIKYGSGVCTEFAIVADYFGEALGLEIKKVSDLNSQGKTGGHAFNKVKIDGVWYYGEPQNKTCEFYPTSAFNEEQMNELNALYNESTRKWLEMHKKQNASTQQPLQKTTK